MNIKKIMQGTIDDSYELKTISYRNGMEVLCVPHEVYIDRIEDVNGNVEEEQTMYVISGKVSLILSIIAEYMKENQLRELDYTLAYREPGFVKKMEFYLGKYNLEK